MKTSKKSFPFLLVTLTLFLGMTAFAQDEEKTKVHLKVMQNDEVTVDTTLQVTSGTDSDELKKLIQDIKGGNVYIKTYHDEEGTFDVFLKNDEDGTVVVKNNIKVIKKQNEEGEEEIEITIIKKDTSKEKKEIKEKKAEKEKK